MDRQVVRKGAEYAHQTGTSLQYFQVEAQPEAAILRSKIDKIQDGLHRMDIISKNHWKDLTMEVRRTKEEKFSHVDLKAWSKKMDDYIFPIFTNLLVRLQGLEGVPPQELFTRGEEDKWQDLEEIPKEEIREVAAHT